MFANMEAPVWTLQGHTDASVPQGGLESTVKEVSKSNAMMRSFRGLIWYFNYIIHSSGKMIHALMFSWQLLM